VDSEVLPASLVDQIKKGAVNLDDEHLKAL